MVYGTSVTHRPDVVHGTNVVHGANMVYSALSCGRTKNLTLSDPGSSPNLANLSCDFGQFTSFLWILFYSSIE